MARPSQRFPRCLTEADAGRRVVNLRPSRGRLGEQPRAHASWFQVSAQPTCGALGCWKTSPGLADRQARGAGRGGQRRRAGHRGPRTVRPDNRPEAGGGAFPAVPGHAQQRDRRHRRDHDREGEPPGAKARARTGGPAPARSSSPCSSPRTRSMTTAIRCGTGNRPVTSPPSSPPPPACRHRRRAAGADEDLGQQPAAGSVIFARLAGSPILPMTARPWATADEAGPIVM
jgi:hypothetical protein